MEEELRKLMEQYTLYLKKIEEKDAMLESDDELKRQISEEREKQTQRSLVIMEQTEKENKQKKKLSRLIKIGNILCLMSTLNALIAAIFIFLTIAFPATFSLFPVAVISILISAAVIFVNNKICNLSNDTVHLLAQADDIKSEKKSELIQGKSLIEQLEKCLMSQTKRKLEIDFRTNIIENLEYYEQKIIALLNSGTEDSEYIKSLKKSFGVDLKDEPLELKLTDKNERQ